MSRLRRFRHLEGERPGREDGVRTRSQGRFEAMRDRGGQLACALCGTMLASAQADCPRCTGAAGGGSRPHGDRFRAVAGNGPLVLEGEEMTRPDEARIASTVPPWRGEAMPPDLAEELRGQLRPPPAGSPQAGSPPPADPLAWADRVLHRQRSRSPWDWDRSSPFESLTKILMAWHVAGRVLGLIVGIGVVLFLLIYQACR